MEKPEITMKSEIKSRVYYDEPERNNTIYDITGNMNIWRVHETYEGTGNEYEREKILNQKK